jgi:hypothetical protein
MSTSLRRRGFRPCLDGFRLEDRVVLSTTNAVEPSAVTASGVDPSSPPLGATLKSSYIQATGVQLHTVFQTFLNQENHAAQGAIKAVGNGQTQDNALNGLRTFTSFQGGALAAKVQQVCSRLPGGVQNLFDSVTSTPATGIGSYVQPNSRLQKQINDMITLLNFANDDSLPNTVNQGSLTILQTYQGCKQVMNLYINKATQNGDFTVVRG